MLCLNANFVLIVFALAFLANQAYGERIFKQNVNTLANDKMDAIIQRMDQLERTVSTFKAQCSCQTQNFLNAERVACTPQLLKICERAGLTDINVNGKSMKVLCGADRWIVALHRFDGSTKFDNKNWLAFKNGIGTTSATTEFFLGLKNLNDLTATHKMELRFEMEDFAGVKKFAQYSDFSVANEQDTFRLGELGAYNGDAGDSFSYHKGQGFTTLDRDNDGKAIGSCGEEYSSAGWFNSCMEANIFGQYYRGEHTHFKEGMYWETFHGPEYSLKSLKKLVRFKC